MNSWLNAYILLNWSHGESNWNTTAKGEYNTTKIETQHQNNRGTMNDMQEYHNNMY